MSVLVPVPLVPPNGTCPPSRRHDARLEVACSADYSKARVRVVIPAFLNQLDNIPLIGRLRRMKGSEFVKTSIDPVEAFVVAIPGKPSSFEFEVSGMRKGRATNFRLRLLDGRDAALVGDMKFCIEP